MKCLKHAGCSVPPDYLLTVAVAEHHAYEAFVTNKLSTLLGARPGQLAPNHEEPQTQHNSPNRSSMMQAAPISASGAIHTPRCRP